MGSELVWLRAFHEMYNPMLGPAVLARLISEYPEARLTMIGPDKGDGSLERTRRAAAVLGVSGACRFVGGVEKREVPAWLAKGDIFLNTTNVDNAPVSVIEAQAAGLCVVSTNVGGIPYLLENEKDALLVAPCDARAMAEAVRRLLVEPGLAASLSQNGRLKAERFDWSYIVPEWESLIRLAAKGGV
jgi:glycosyltransferase involved in cell wall biosynthesis